MNLQPDYTRIIPKFRAACNALVDVSETTAADHLRETAPIILDELERLRAPVNMVEWNNAQAQHGGNCPWHVICTTVINNRVRLL